MFTLNCKWRLLVLEQPIVMGILNLTDDSFYEGSRLRSIEDVLRKAEQQIKEGATILDIGGQSTRPGSDRITADEELQKVIPAIESIAKKFPGQLISVDTFYSKVAKEAVDAGASIINDISAGSIDPDLIPTVAELRVPYILMHMQGTPQTMQDEAIYDDVLSEVFDFLNFRSAVIKKIGIRDIIVDPGFGFGKTISHNMQLLKQLAFFKQLQRPIMVGLSRKSTIYKTLGISANDALNGSTVLHTIALLQGANILRVHDVKEAVEAIKLVQLYQDQ